jgi:hypothetical protein
MDQHFLELEHIKKLLQQLFQCFQVLVTLTQCLHPNLKKKKARDQVLLIMIEQVLLILGNLELNFHLHVQTNVKSNLEAIFLYLFQNMVISIPMKEHGLL